MIVIMRQHEQKYKSGDKLSAAQAAEVVSENSGRSILSVNMARLIERGWIVGAYKVGRVYIYPYEAVKDLIISDANKGRKPRPDEELSKKPESIYNRRYFRKLAEQKRQTKSR